jgi:flagellar biosynthetic protein FliQ
VNTASAIDIFRNMLIACAWVTGPVLAAALVVGLVVGVLQTATQVNDQSAAFTIKLLAVAAALGIVGPEMLTQLVEYTRRSIASIAGIVQ